MSRKPETPVSRNEDSQLKRYCKNIQLDKDWIMACMLECFSDKWKRRDVEGFLAGYQTGQPLSVRAVSRLIQENRSNVDPLLERAAEDLAREIKERDVHFPEIHYSMRYDGNSGKLREIGVESIKQQIYNYVAVNALKELLKEDIDVRVVSMPSMELFEQQDAKYKDEILPHNVRARLSIEMASDLVGINMLV